MPLTLKDKATPGSRPVHLVTKESFSRLELDAGARAWAGANHFSGAAGQLLLLPGSDGAIAGALFGVADKRGGFSPLATGSLAKKLPAGEWHFASTPEDPDLAALGLLLGSYVYTRYRKHEGRDVEFVVPEGADAARVRQQAEAVFLVRDLINTPTNDFGPKELEAAARSLADAHGAKVSVISGDALIEQNFPMIHAVGRASAQAPRLIDFSWGAEDAPKVTLVGKGVCFDTGGLDIKPPSSMLLMKKDMGGAANVLGLASMLMAAKANIRLRVLIPAVENSISANAFRPGDILPSRKGLTVEIGNTDAEGRLILADALALADEESPEVLIDMATLTGAARVALGPDLPPFFTDDDTLAENLAHAAEKTADPLWRLPLWSNYDSKLNSKVADINNVTTDGMAGAVTAALFLRRFVENARRWAHFDVFGWSPVERPHCPIGGEAQAIRAILDVLVNRYGVR
ncbi:M17 family metallopeptidase [Aminobacter sp. J44]|uniref:leucyl aminopeptidase family protein n=1 Tax=Aminobacter sp. J44 TaxID=935262 RepID=UPI001199A8BD|nr:leucyl aminopeptidase family protein [Aminobacter sp. J44]TWG65591.1 leucyl aminopeptidase [Aminobacter sp. J44]